MEQILSRQIPVVKEQTLPPIQQLKHWRGFSLIVLDWELFPDAEGAGDIGPGIALPQSFQENNDQNVSTFIDELLRELYCPIFIFSSQDIPTIESELTSRLNVDRQHIGERIMLRSKADMSANLFEELTAWISERPAIYALKSWNHGYEKAKKELFADFHASSPNWPKILWKTSGLDSVNPHSELSETITRNIVHRFEPLVFDDNIFNPKEGEAIEPPEALRRVIHGQAVISNRSLHSDVLMPGDFFYEVPDENQDGELPTSILINVTPACDLVARRDVSIDETSITLLQADLIPKSEYRTRRQIESVEKERSNDYSVSQFIYVLTDSASPYRLMFRKWNRTTWGEIKHLRRGRLLDPHITQLQQKFALYFHRQGLPRLPDDYFQKPEI